MLLSEKVPVAMNCWVVATAMFGLVGVTVMDTSAAPDELPPAAPPPPPQPAASTAISRTRNIFNFICPLNLSLSVPDTAS